MVIVVVGRNAGCGTALTNSFLLAAGDTEAGRREDGGGYEKCPVERT